MGLDIESRQVNTRPVPTLSFSINDDAAGSDGLGRRCRQSNGAKFALAGRQSPVSKGTPPNLGLGWPAQGANGRRNGTSDHSRSGRCDASLAMPSEEGQRVSGWPGLAARSATVALASLQADRHSNSALAPSCHPLWRPPPRYPGQGHCGSASTGKASRSTGLVCRHPSNP